MVANRLRKLQRLVPLAIILSAWAAPALAQPAVRDLVADLGSPQIMKREEAMRVLSSDESIKLGDLEALLADSTLNAEQRCRLAQAAKDRFMASPRPAMGVQFDSMLPDRVAIEKVYSEFPASEVLKPGDIIVSCEGEPLRSRSAWVRLGAHIFSHEPGETVNIVVRRGAEKLDLTIKLGLYDDLSTRAGPGIERLEHAWDLRSRRFTPAPAAPIVPELPDEEWRPEPNILEIQKMARFRAQLPQTVVPKLVAGGEPRGGQLDYDELIALSRQNLNPDALINRAWAQQQLVQGGGNAWSSNGVVMQTTQQELSSLENRRLSMEKQLEAMRLPGSISPEQMALQTRSMALYREQIERVKKQIEGIRAEAAEEAAAGAAAESKGK